MSIQPAFKLVVYAILTIALSACSFGGTSEDQVFTLYRNSLTAENMRIHIATFDAAQKEEYNRGNCEQAQVLFQNQPGVKTKFWCEKGRFKK